jgi:hypothetical protein
MRRINRFKKKLLTFLFYGSIGLAASLFWNNHLVWSKCSPFCLSLSEIRTAENQGSSRKQFRGSGDEKGGKR